MSNNCDYLSLNGSGIQYCFRRAYFYTLIHKRRCRRQPSSANIPSSCHLRTTGRDGISALPDSFRPSAGETISFVCFRRTICDPVSCLAAILWLTPIWSMSSLPGFPIMPTIPHPRSLFSPNGPPVDLGALITSRGNRASGQSYPIKIPTS